MNKATLITVAAILALACSCSAQENGYWTASGTTATAITSDIAIANNRISIDYTNFPMSLIRALTPAELTAAFDADPGTPGNGHLYRLNVPAEKHFLHKSPLCGEQDTQWMATYVSGRTLLVDFFSGSNPPTLTFEALNNASNLCGTFTYGR